MLDGFPQVITDLGHWGYLAVFVAATLESAAFIGLLVPGESIVLLAGFLASRGVFEPVDLFIIVAAGAILGDTLGYELGRRAGRAALVKHGRWIGVDGAALKRVDRFFARYGGKAVFAGRFVGFLRALAPFVAGSSGMRYSVFLPYNAAGGVMWAATFVWLGFVLGESWHRAEVWMGRASVVVAAVFAGFIGLTLLWRWAERHEAAITRRFAAVRRRATTGAIGVRVARARSFLIARLSPEGELGLYLTVGVLVLVTFAWIFGGIAQDVVAGDPLTHVDRLVSHWFEAHNTPGLTRVVELLTQLGGWRVVAALSVAAGAYFLWRGLQYWLTGLVLVVPGGELLNVLLKHAFHRARPQWAHPLVMLTSFSFPSGHAMSATTLYGFLAVWLMVTLDSWRRRVAVAVSAAALILLIATSRVYLGAHYPSDVLAGIAAGLVWLAVCLTAVEAHRRRS